MLLTARDLTGTLRAGGALQRGEVARVEVREQRETAVSHLQWLEVEFSPGSYPALPNRLLLKWPIAASPADPSSETTFYRELAPALASPPIVHCLATALESDAVQWLLLEDLRESHACPPWPEHPPDHDLQAAVAVLARLHAHWWQRPGVAITLGTSHTEASLRTMVGAISAQLPAFVEHLGDDLAADDREVLERVFNSPLGPWLRIAEPRDLTLIHGDAHVWNFLFQRTGPGTPYLIDWQTWHVDVGARDLAFMIALHWSRPLRQRLERALLELYYADLTRAGVTTYSFEELMLDYRRCVVRNLTFPIIFWSRGFPRERWRYRLDCALAAYRDLDGEDML
jgi:hypothetical protein